MRKPMTALAAAIASLGLACVVTTANAQSYRDRNLTYERYPAAWESATPLMSEDDRGFIEKIGYAGNAELQISRLALDRSTNPAVTQFAQQMIDDHSVMRDRLSKLGNNWSVLPPMSLSHRDRLAYNKLSGLSGAAFDRAFADWQCRAHEAVLDSFKDRMAFTRIDDISHFISNEMPTIRQHLREAKNLKRDLGR